MFVEEIKVVAVVVASGNVASVVASCVDSGATEVWVNGTEVVASVGVEEVGSFGETNGCFDVDDDESNDDVDDDEKVESREEDASKVEASMAPVVGSIVNADEFVTVSAFRRFRDGSGRLSVVPLAPSFVSLAPSVVSLAPSVVSLAPRVVPLAPSVVTVEGLSVDEKN